jgi:hypothetical protein
MARSFPLRLQLELDQAVTLTVEQPSERVFEQLSDVLAALARQKAIEITQPLVLLFQEFAVGDHFRNWRFWFRV